MRLLTGLALVVLAACASGAPQPIDYGRENCEYCRMVVDDRRFAAEVITSTGKARKFDSIECMASYVAQQGAPQKIRAMYVTDFRNPGTLIAAESAQYVRGGSVSSPMGMGLAATSAGDPVGAARALGGEPLSWEQVLQLVRSENPAHAGHGDSAGAAH